MEIYDVNLGDKRIAKPTRWRMFLILFAVTAPICFVMHLIWPTHGKSEAVGEALFFAIPFSLLMSLIYSTRKMRLYITRSWASYQIVVEDDQISTRNYASQSWMLSKAIHRGEIRTVIENEHGLLISKHDRFGTRMWGGIWIPNRLPDYEYLKRMITEWRGQDSHRLPPATLNT